MKRIFAALVAVFLWASPTHAQRSDPPCVSVERMRQALADVFYRAEIVDLEGTEAALYIAGFNRKVPDARVVADRVLVLVLNARVALFFSKDGEVCGQRYALGIEAHARLLDRAAGVPL